MIALSGCTSKWEYRPKSYSQDKTTEYSVQIPQFTDARAEGSEDVMKGGKFALQWVPFVVKSNVTDVHHPEGKLIDMSDMSTVFPKATGAELASSELFKTISVMPNNKEKTDYTLKGTIVETHATKNVSAYGLSFAGNVLSLLGIPSGVARSSITVRFELIDKKGNVVFDKKYTEVSSRPVYIYNELSKKYFMQQSDVYQNINLHLIKDLKKTLIK